MFSKIFGSVIAAIALSVSSTAIAQTTNTKLALHLQVGVDNNGDPIVLDTGSVQRNEYTILQKQGSGIKKTTFRAACDKGRLFSEKSAVYNASGELMSEKQIKKEITLKPGTPEANSMEIVCQQPGN